MLRAARRATPVIVVPSMNTELWHDPHFQRSVDLLNETQKYRVLSPTESHRRRDGLSRRGRPLGDVIAEQPTEVIEVDLDDVRGYLRNQPAWLRVLIRSLSDHLRQLDDGVVGRHDTT